jgi:chromosome segregation ATPase
MDTTSYATALAAAKQELADANAELGEAQQKVQDLGNRIADLRQTVTVLSKLCGEENVEIEDALGLTDAIRVMFRDAHTEAFTVQDVRLRLEARGFQTRRYGNLLASIHVVVGRLVTKNEIMQAGTKGGADKPSYRWAYKMDPLPY